MTIGIELIEWTQQHDICSSWIDSYQSMHEFMLADYPINSSVGFAIYEDEKVVSLALGIFNNGTPNTIHRFAKGVINRRWQIGEWSGVTIENIPLENRPKTDPELKFVDGCPIHPYDNGAVDGLRIEVIQWFDPCLLTPITHVANLKNHGQMGLTSHELIVSSVGFVVYEDEQTVILTTTVLPSVNSVQMSHVIHKVNICGRYPLSYLTSVSPKQLGLEIL